MLHKGPSSERAERVSRLDTSKGKGLWPVLRTVENARNLNRVGLDLIDHDIGQRGECQFTPSSHAAAGSSEMREIPQAGASVINGSRDAPGCFGIVALDPFANALQILGGWQGPANLHQGRRNRSRRWPTCSCVIYSPRSNPSSPRFTASRKRRSSSKWRATTSCTSSSGLRPC